MNNAFGKQLRELRTVRKILQATFAEKCRISAAYLSDIERGRRNPPSDKVILEWAAHLDAGDAEEIGQGLIALAARDQGVGRVELGAGGTDADAGVEAHGLENRDPTEERRDGPVDGHVDPQVVHHRPG